jgi:hypothetical protein
MLIRSAKCHLELDGEGIESDWGAAKQWCRRQKLAEKDQPKSEPNEN